MLSRSSSRCPSTIAGPRYSEEGQTATEYALILGAIAVVLIVGMLLLAGKVNDLFTRAGGEPGILRPPTAQCDPNYAGACVPPHPPALDCAALRALGLPLPVRVVGADPHGLDPDGDGLGC